MPQDAAQQFGWPWETLAHALGIGEGKHVTSKFRGNGFIDVGEQPSMSFFQYNSVSQALCER